MKDKIDVLGNQLNEGDFIMRSDGNYKGLYLTVITGFTAKMVRTKGGLEHPSNIMRISNADAERFKQHFL